jgi:hypothetical protein
MLQAVARRRQRSLAKSLFAVKPRFVWQSDRYVMPWLNGAVDKVAMLIPGLADEFLNPDLNRAPERAFGVLSAVGFLLIMPKLNKRIWRWRRSLLLLQKRTRILAWWIACVASYRLN